MVALQVDVDRAAANNDESTEVVPTAANRLLGTRVATNSNNRKRAASQAEKTGDARKVDSQEPGEESHSRISDTSDGVAAVGGTSVALVWSAGRATSLGNLDGGSSPSRRKGGKASCKTVSVGLGGLGRDGGGGGEKSYKRSSESHFESRRAKVLGRRDRKT